ncbi:MAG: tRNA (adenosine(37)-N6)-threonylcarbamoyltransferase complex ATPase subunit type 1 TsaE [Thermodesulfobacteriota bacterium]
MTATSFNIKLLALADTEHLGRLLGEIARAGDVIILSGSLGAGKTTMTQSIGAGLGVPANCYITSPTFSLMHEYQGRLTLYHMDLYRLSSEEEIEDLGFLEYIYGDGLSVIEWPNRLGSLMPEEYLEIKLELQDTVDTRTARISAAGNQWRPRLGKIQQMFSG